jgi:putative CocE/NonD family hydrolase
LYLNRTGALSTSSNTNKNDSSTFLYNPYDPSPTIGGPTLRNDLVQGPYDQRALVESRQDVLIFSSEQLQEDLKLKGNVKVHLRVSSDRPDTDFDIRLTDVYPDGRSMLINDAVMRMRFRNGFTLAQSSMMVPGVVYDCEITLPASCITFLNGHRIRIIISSSNYPRFNRNMNNGNEMYPGKSTDSLLNPLQANNTVYFNADQVSYIDLPIEGYNNSIPTTGTWNELKIFPVPANDRIFIESVSSYTGEISIRDAYGRELIHQIEYDPAQGIDVSSLASGNYILYFKDQKSSAQIKFSICL